MSTQPRMLDHPFYQAWTRGEISRESLAVYHRAYADFVLHIPDYWQRVVNAFHPNQPPGPSVVHEEQYHIFLWQLWGRDLIPPDGFPRMQETLDAFEILTPSSLLGALHVFELQQPEIAEVKKRALLKYYGLPEEDLRYFDAHMHEEPHIAYGRWLGENFADPQEFQAGMARGAELVYNSLNMFMNPGVS